MTAIRETFSEGASLIHRLDPRVRLVVAAFFSVLVALAGTFEVVVPALGLSCLWLALARLNLKKVAARLLVVNGFILLLWLILPVTFPGEPVFHIGPLTGTREGLSFALLLTLKSHAIVLALLALVATIPIPLLGQALQRLRLPDKVCHLLLFTYRYLYVLEQEYQRLSNAMKMRGFRPRTNLHTYRTYAHLVGILLVRSYDRAERVFQAMLCRGFQGRFYSLGQFCLHRRDLIFLAAMCPLGAGLLFLSWQFPR